MSKNNVIRLPHKTLFPLRREIEALVDAVEATHYGYSVIIKPLEDTFGVWPSPYQRMVKLYFGKSSQVDLAKSFAAIPDELTELMAWFPQREKLRWLLQEAATAVKLKI